jgi:hypothetical protein
MKQFAQLPMQPSLAQCPCSANFCLKSGTRFQLRGLFSELCKIARAVSQSRRVALVTALGGLGRETGLSKLDKNLIRASGQVGVALVAV